MPAKDIYHDHCKNALIKDGWIITHDPLSLKIGKKDMFVDLGAEKFLAAEKQGQKIAIEIKSFLGASEIEDLTANSEQTHHKKSYLIGSKNRPQ